MSFHCLCVSVCLSVCPAVALATQPSRVRLPFVLLSGNNLGQTSVVLTADRFNVDEQSASYASFTTNTQSSFVSKNYFCNFIT